ncbi:unnamed protein product, partial [Musa textilis]
WDKAEGEGVGEEGELLCRGGCGSPVPDLIRLLRSLPLPVRRPRSNQTGTRSTGYNGLLELGVLHNSCIAYLDNIVWHNPSSGQARSRSLASWIFVDHTVKEETVRDLNLSVERALLFLHINLTAPLYYFSFDGCYLLTSTSSLLLLFFFLPHSHLSSEMMMRFTSVLLTLFLFLLLHQGSSPKATAATHPDIADETCRRIADDDPNVNYTFCTQALRSVSKSKRADLRGLAIISLKLAKANATHAKSRVKALLKEKQLSTYRKSCLQTCRELYSDAASSFRNSVKQIKSGRYADAKVYMSSAVDAPGECEDSFQEGDITSPLTKVNYDLFQLAVIALAITSRLG